MTGNEKENVLRFFGDFNLNRRENLTPCVGEPDLVPEATIEDPSLSLTYAYPAVFRMDDGSYQCLHQACGTKGCWYALLRESRDGIHWQAPDLKDRVVLEDRVFPNQILPAEKGEWGMWFNDTQTANSQTRFKGFFDWSVSRNYLKTRLLLSADAVNWRTAEGIEWQAQSIAPDPPACAFWNPIRESYVLTVRPMWTDRRIAVVETKDWMNFTEPELSLEADALDTPCAELYGMPVIHYGDIFIGLLWVFHPSPQELGDHKYVNGKIDCQLAYSRNGWHFQRSLRSPLFPNAAPGEYGAGCIFPGSVVIDNEHRIRIYSSASKVEHGILSPGAGAILLHTLRLDGFVYLQSAGGTGWLGTRPLYWRGGEVKLNVQAPQGEVRAQVTNREGKILDGYSFKDCSPFAGDDLFWCPLWRNGKTLSALAGKVIRLEIKLLNGRIYAIRGNFLPLVAAQARRLEENGENPQKRKGF